MSPFDQNIDNDAGHTIDQNDLIAFHLHELSPQQERAVRRVLHIHPGLQSESLAIASTLRAFPKHEPSLPLNAAALDRHWLAVRPSLPSHIAPAMPPRSLFARSLFTRWALPTIAASVLAAAALFLSLHHNAHPAPSTLAIATPPRLAAITSKAAHSPSSVPTATSVPPSRSVSSSDSIFSASTPADTAINPARPTLFAPTQPETSQASTSIPIAEPAMTPAPAKPIASNLPIDSSTPPSVLPPATSLLQSTESAGSSSPFALHHAPTHRGFAQANARNDVALSLQGAFSNSATPGNSNFYRQNPAASVGGLVEFRHISKPLLGWEATYSFRRANELYDELVYEPVGSSCGNTVCPAPTYAVSANAQQFTADWVASGHIRSFRPFVLLGAGLLLTRPLSGQSGTASSSQAAVDYGAGIDWRLAPRIGLRLQYRGDLYKAPGIVPPNNTSPNTGFMHTSEPAIGMYYRF
jgi:hypothetical protein